MAFALTGIILLSAADLALALGHLKTRGLYEANPIAALLIKTTGSAMILSAYKVLTVGICVGLLYRLRKRVEGEVAAWCAMAILVITALQWHAYTRQLDGVAPISLVGTGLFSERLLLLD